ncbi:MAG: hypothetical protein JWO38_6530, partial [Gemmataceae bacterium]|nr:hypothetical protein [Gemmataceae bacterium]
SAVTRTTRRGILARSCSTICLPTSKDVYVDLVGDPARPAPNPRAYALNVHGFLV